MTRRLMAAASLGLALLATPARASEWGCEVLLCASNPAGWKNIAACHPPMTKLIACLSKWSPCAWPTCPEANSGGPGYAQYDDCPEGYTPGVTDSGGRSSGSVVGGGQTAVCIGQMSVRGGDYTAVSIFGGDKGGSPQPHIIPRPLKEKPYYFDIDGERYWFSLH